MLFEFDSLSEQKAKLKVVGVGGAGGRVGGAGGCGACLR